MSLGQSEKRRNLAIRLPCRIESKESIYDLYMWIRNDLNMSLMQDAILKVRIGKLKANHVTFAVHNVGKSLMIHAVFTSFCFFVLFCVCVCV